MTSNQTCSPYGYFPIMDNARKTETALQILNSEWVKAENSETKRNEYWIKGFCGSTNLFHNEIRLVCVGKGIYDVKIDHNADGKDSTIIKNINGLEEAKKSAINNAINLVILGELCY